MATTTNALSITQLDNAVGKLNIKLARQLSAVKDTEAHISALQALRAQLERAK